MQETYFGASKNLGLGTLPSNAGLGLWLLWACLSVWLAGCATSADPHEGGFVSGVVGLAGGGYQQRVNEREGVHQGELNAQQRLKAQARALEQERAQVRGDLARAQTRLASQERRIAKERARLATAHQGSAETQASLRRLDQAQAQVASTKGALRSVRTDEEAVTDLQSRSRDIEKELDEIDSMVGVVSATQF
jgi:hypothetical protein